LRAKTHHETAPLEAARAEAQRASAAESRRVLYVALTRARDRLVLSGEASRGGESWRGMVEAGLASRPELAVRIPFAEASGFSVQPAFARGEGGAPGAVAGPVRSSSVAPGMAEAAPEGAPIRLASPPRVEAVRLAVTELAEHARCPRRAFLARHLKLSVNDGPAAQENDDPDRATARGTLAHAMISELDLLAPPLERRAQLAAAALRRGHDPGSRAVRRILARR
jgi:ATP-dependent exoDNAse (exonuclease V) beta subunit